MRIVTWNMGCGSRATGYRKHHDEAWSYLLRDLSPDIALVQEAVITKIALSSADYAALVCELPSNIDAGTAILVRRPLSAELKPLLLVQHTYLVAAHVSVSAGPATFVSAHVYPGQELHASLRGVVQVLSETAQDHPLIVGGDFNAARHFDTVYGGRKHAEFFAAWSTLASTRFIGPFTARRCRRFGADKQRNPIRTTISS